MATIASFPDLPYGVLYARYHKPAPQLDTITYEQKFADGSIAVNAVSSTAPQTWELTLEGLQPFEADVYSEHYLLAVHNLNSFPFTERNGTIQTGVKYLKFERDHSKQWIHSIKVTLIKYPG